MPAKSSSDKPTADDSSDSTKPVFQSPVYGNVSASLFSHRRENAGGQKYTDYDVSLSVSYTKDGERHFKNLSLKPREVMAAIQALTDAYRARYSQSASESGEG